MPHVTVTNSRMGAGMLFKGAGTVSSPATSMGGTDGGINGSVETEHFEHKFDQTGTAPVDLTRTGFRARFEAEFAEVTLDNLVNSFPGDAVTGANPDRTVKLNGNIGQQALRDGLGDRYTLIPQIAPDEYVTDSEECLVIPVGYCMGNLALPYGVTDHRKFSTIIEALPDTSDSNTRIIFGLGAPIADFEIAA